jgi:uncharacterized protein YneF (UPF0154 family)
LFILLKIIILLLLLAIVASLFSGLVFLFRDSEKKDSKRTLHALGVRITLAVALIATISYGLYTGELAINAPWHKNPATQGALPPRQ